MDNTQEVSPENEGKSQKSLSKLEVFGLVTGVIGLIADTVGLVTFAAGIWGFANDKGSSAPSYALFITVTGLLLVYGWLALAWIITSRTLKRFPGPPAKSDLDDKATRSTVGIGLLLVPLAIIWFAIAFSGNSVPLQSSAFPTPTVVTPALSMDQVTISPVSTSPTSSKTEAIAAGVFFTMVYLYPLVGVGVYGCIDLLMPLVYGDLIDGAETTTAEYSERIKAHLEENWANLEERISIELRRYNWIEVNQLQDVADLLEVPLGSLEIAFAKYASTHPTEVKYGYLYSANGFQLSEWKVLVNADYDLEDRYMD